MSPTSRNTLIIGGGLIVVALLFTCGPLGGLFGGDDAVKTAVDTPPVAAGPPEAAGDAADVAAAATSGAATGAGAGAMGAAMAGLDEGAADGGRTAAGDVDETVVAAAGVVPADAGSATPTGAGAGSGAATTTAASTATPPVSAGPPATANVPSADTADTAAAAAAAAAGAASAFDDAYAGPSGNGIDAAGKVVDRFAPPVAAVPTGGLAMNGAQRSIGSSIGGVRQPCDSPGAGCRNASAPGGPPPIRPVVPGPRGGSRGGRSGEI